MKKIISIIMMSLMLVMIFSTMSFATEMTPIKLIAITDVDTPYNTNSQLDTTVEISEDSYSYFVESKWELLSGSLYRLTVKTRTYRNYIYDENTRATINGNEAEILEIKEENRYITFAYTFPKEESTTGPIDSSSLTHPITIMYLSNGRISPNPIRAPHRKNTIVQIIPDEGYQVKDVLVDGESVGAVTEYTFKRVTESHKIKAYFEPIPGYVPTEKEEIESGEISGDIEEITYHFEDVAENEWYYDAVQHVCTNKIFAGTSENTFEPDTVMTRAMIAKVLFNHSNENKLIENVESGENKFEDVPENEWYAEAVNWAVVTEITNGTSDTTYSPEEGLTREQLVTLLYRYAKAIELDVSVGENTNILSYDDAFNISEYAVEAFQWACGSGVITGKTKSTLAPQDFVTRAEVATMIMRFNNIK